MEPTLVTGGLGYVGRYIVEQLREKGTEVVSYNRDFYAGDVPGVHFVQGELFDIPRLVRTIGEHGIGRIVHTAAMSHPELSVDLPITTFAANVDGTLHVLEAARLTDARRVLCFSSECAYGVRLEPLVTEDMRLEPTTPHGGTKAACEMLAHVYNERYGFDITSLRVSEVYGPGNRMAQYLCELIDAALDGVPYRLPEGADHPFQFVHARDVARAAVQAVTADRLGQEAYNITGGTRGTPREAAGAGGPQGAGARVPPRPRPPHPPPPGDWGT